MRCRPRRQVGEPGGSGEYALKEKCDSAPLYPSRTADIQRRPRHLPIPLSTQRGRPSRRKNNRTGTSKSLIRQPPFARMSSPSRTTSAVLSQIVVLERSRTTSHGVDGDEGDGRMTVDGMVVVGELRAKVRLGEPGVQFPMNTTFDCLFLVVDGKVPSAGTSSPVRLSQDMLRQFRTSAVWQQPQSSNRPSSYILADPKQPAGEISDLHLKPIIYQQRQIPRKR